MKKRNVMIQTAVASALLVLMGAANAGTVSAVNTKFAAEAFKAAAGTAMTPGAASYNFVAPNGNVNLNGVVYFQVRLTGGAKFAAATPVANDFKVAGGVAGAGVTVQLSTDGTTAQVTYTAPAQTALGVNALVWTPSALGVVAPVAFSTPGSTVQAQFNFSTVSAGAAGAPLDSTNALPASGDGVTPSLAIATSGQAVIGSVSALGGATAYAQKIDLTATPTASLYTPVTGKTSLGAVKFTNSTTAYLTAAGAAQYTTENDGANAATMSATIDVTPGAGQSFPVGAVLSYTDSTTEALAIVCGGNKGALAAITAGTSGTKKTLTVAAGDLTSGNPIAVCMTAPSATNTATPITATLTGTTVPSVSAADTGDTVTGLGYFLDFNGQSKVIRNYIPAALTGFIQTVRVINTGSVAAPVSVSLIDDVTGAAGSSVVIIPSLAVGAATRLSQAQIETAVGAVAASARPRLRFTAPTNGMDVQSFFNNASGAFTNLSGAE